MTIEERMSKLEKAFGANDELVRELRDAVTVTAQLEARQGKVLKEHTEWLVANEQELKEWIKTQKEQGKIIDQRIANLVSGIGEFMRRTP